MACPHSNENHDTVGCVGYQRNNPDLFDADNDKVPIIVV